MTIRKQNSAEHTWLKFAEAIEEHMLYLAIERGLSETYQLSTRRVLEDFAKWILAARRLIFSASHQKDSPH